MTLRAVVLISTFALGATLAGCRGSSPHVQTTDLPYTVAPIKPNIEAARESNRDLFSIFPSPGTSQACRIPRGGPVSKVTTLPGTCATGLTYNLNGNAIVTFRERWHQPNDKSRSWQHTWRVILNPENKIVATQSVGAAAPQTWS